MTVFRESRLKVVRSRVPLPAWRARTAAWPIALLLTVSACGDGPSSPSGPSPSGDHTASGSVRDRIAGGAIDGSTITFSGPVTKSGRVTAGEYRVAGLVSGLYTVGIDGPAHVKHETRGVFVQASASFSFTVLAWGSGRFGAVYDETFHRFFHQVARVRSSGTAALRKWMSPPADLYLVEGTVPDEQLAFVASVLQEVNTETVPALWCDTTGPLPITSGPDVTSSTAGRIVIRPNWDLGSTGTLGTGNIQSGVVTLNVRPLSQRVATREELKGALAHELFHVAGAFHLCGGDVGDNPFGFSRTKCPYPDSLMANMSVITRPSVQDRLLSCIIYHPGTLPGNTLPDTNPGYVPLLIH